MTLEACSGEFSLCLVLRFGGRGLDALSEVGVLWEREIKEDASNLGG